MTTRKVLTHWTEVHKVINGEVKVTTCCCKAPGASARDCMLKTGNKTRCRCFCHSKLHESEWKKRRK